MLIARTAYVARTAHDQKHGNRLQVPEFAAIEIRLVKDKAGSKSYLPATAQPPREPQDTGDDKFHFAPGPQLDPGTMAEDAAKTDRVTLRYHLFNPALAIKEAKIELFRRWDKNPMWTRTLEGDELTDGEHDLEFEYDKSTGGKEKKKEWDGSVTKAPDTFPDGFLTVEHSPYKLRLTVKGDGRCESPVVWTYFHVLIDKIELEYGVKEAITNTAIARKPFEELKASSGSPADGSNPDPAKIHLISNLFKKGHSMFDNSLFDEYKTMWEHGPEIPVFAKVWIRDSAGKAVLAPRALGNTKFLWDWESTSADTGYKFVDKAQDYLVKKTKPKGRNCHVARGGKRISADAAEQVFPEQGGYDPETPLRDGTFPFHVETTAAPRGWSAQSKAWTRGPLASKTGVLFRPSRMAGDSYRLWVYAAHERKVKDKLRLPTMKDDAPLECSKDLFAKSVRFEVWRKIHFVRYMRKKPMGSTASFNPMRDYYRDAFLEVEDARATAVEDYPQADWTTAFNAAYGALSAFDRYLFDPAAQWTRNEGAVARTRNQLIAHLAGTYALPRPANPGETAAAVWDDWLTGQGFATDADLATHVENLAISMLESIFDSKLHASEGVNLFEVELSNNLVPNLPDGFTSGLAHDFASGADKGVGAWGGGKCAFLSMYSAGRAGGGAAAIQEVSQTAAHEIGHHLFLPHPANTAENTGANAKNNYDAHDVAISNCLMSYVNGARTLCGLCRLRLRGWDKSKLRTKASENSK